MRISSGTPLRKREGGDAQSASGEEEWNCPKDTNQNRGRADRQENSQRIENHHDIENLNQRVERSHGRDRTFAGDPGPGLDGLFNDEVTLLDKDEGHDVGKRHRRRAERKVFFRESGVVEFHAAVQVVDAKVDEDFRDSPEKGFPDVAVMVREGRFPG